MQRSLPERHEHYGVRGVPVQFLAPSPSSGGYFRICSAEDLELAAYRFASALSICEYAVLATCTKCWATRRPRVPRVVPLIDGGVRWREVQETGLSSGLAMSMKWFIGWYVTQGFAGLVEGAGLGRMDTILIVTPRHANDI